MIYLSGTYNRIPAQYRHRFGYMLNVNRPIGSESAALQYPWMLDNGAFSRLWQEDTWLRRLHQLAPHQDNCIAAIVPDVIHDHVSTLERWKKYAPVVKAAGYRAAFVTQDGCRAAEVPWEDLDVLFIGGSDQHKLVDSLPLIDDAIARGVHVHVARVNSARRILRFSKADSADGTHFVYDNREVEIERILWAAEQRPSA